ncbi:MAG: hypothetical protein DI564_05630 [Rhodanobacter denitrificans]|uniref:Uncharacterized protein n=1 Tax=Rhodanobacter denitrificans TaxID=666685 RepID=A0A2W5KSA7_9GAMM|nr:MAG: hypothetical protein DI564_05630 [Rhodanobacter denitrificans]
MAQRKTAAGSGRQAAARKPQAERAVRAAPAVRTARPVKAAPPATSDAEARPGKDAKKHKLVRDSFTMPRADFELIHTLKERALGFKRPAKKSELLRAGLQALAALDDAALKARLDRLVPLKPGRPKQKP